jgi:hypothetical protein
MRGIIDKCPVCAEKLDNHAYADLGSVFTNDSNAIATAKAAFENNDWLALTQLDQWEPNADVLSYKAIKCNRQSELGLIAILFTAEMWSADVVLDSKRLSSETSKALEGAVGDRWIPL